MKEFKKLNTKLMDVCNRLIDSQELCKLISVDNESPLSAPDIINPESLIKKRIYPAYVNPETITDSRSQISVYFDNIKGSSSFKGVVLCFMIVSHHSLKFIEGGSRVYEIFDTLMDLFDKSEGFGLGKMELELGKLTIANKDYDGMVMMFHITEFR